MPSPTPRLDATIAKALSPYLPREWREHATKAVRNALLAEFPTEAPNAESVTRWQPFLRIPLGPADD